jgi:hypothetical protein
LKLLLNFNHLNVALTVAIKELDQVFNLEGAQIAQRLHQELETSYVDFLV